MTPRPCTGFFLAGVLLLPMACAAPGARYGARRLEALDRAIHRGRFGEAERALAAARRGASGSAVEAAALHRLEGELRLLQRRPGEARASFEKALEACVRAFGPESPEAAAARLDVADAYAAAGELREAERLFRASIGPESPRGALAERLSELALASQARGRGPEAERYYREAAEATEKAYGKADPLTAARLADWGLQLQRLERFAEAEAAYRRALAGVERAFPAGHARRDAALNALGLFLEARGRYGEAEELYRRALDEAASGGSEAGRNYASLLRRLGREKEASAVEARSRGRAP